MGKLTVRVHREGDGYWGEVVELPGCFASGESLDELREAMTEAIRLYREGDDSPGTAVAGEPLEVDALTLRV
jgi:predicted RNase H-like HicB family nuclease